MPISHPLPHRSKEDWGEDPAVGKDTQASINNQLEGGESNNEKDDPAFADPDHVAEDKEETEAETVEATTTVSLVEQMEVELAASTSPPQPTLPQTSLQKLESVRFCTPSQRWNTA